MLLHSDHLEPLDPKLNTVAGGDVIVGFYDRREDAQNLLYKHYYAFIHSDGTAIQANFPDPQPASNFTYHTQAKGDANFIGDYHDVWTWTYPEGTRTVDAWIFIQDQTVIGDIYLRKVKQP